MTDYSYGLVGIGKLGSAMMKQWKETGTTVGVYHPDQKKTDAFVQQYHNGFKLTENNIQKVDYLLLALPAFAIIPFLEQNVKMNRKTTYVNMATSLETKTLQHQFPDHNIISMKYMGHSNYLYDNGNGLFITEKTLPTKLENLFNPIGQVIVDDPNIVQHINKQATYYAVKSAFMLESSLNKEQLPPAYIETALQSIVPEVTRAYSKGTLGHFGKNVVKEMMDSHRNE